LDGIKKKTQKKRIKF